MLNPLNNLLPLVGNEQSAVNLSKGLDHDQHMSGINKNNVAAANEVSAWDWTGNPRVTGRLKSHLDRLALLTIMEYEPLCSSSIFAQFN